MNITIDFRHPWSISDKVARIERNDLNGKQARRVLHAARAQLSRDKYSSLFASFAWWCRSYAGEIDPLGDWLKACEERRKLEELCRRYEPRTYTEKELDDLTRAEWDEIVPWELDMLDDFQRARYGV